MQLFEIRIIDILVCDNQIIGSYLQIFGKFITGIIRTNCRFQLQFNHGYPYFVITITGKQSS